MPVNDWESRLAQILSGLSPAERDGLTQHLEERARELGRPLSELETLAAVRGRLTRQVPDKVANDSIKMAQRKQILAEVQNMYFNARDNILIASSAETNSQAPGTKSPVQDALSRPVSVEKQQALKQQRDELQARWAWVQQQMNTLPPDSPVRKRLQEVKDQLQAQQLEVSNTVANGPEEARSNVLRAREYAETWARSGQPLTIEHLQEVNRLLGERQTYGAIRRQSDGAYYGAIVPQSSGTYRTLSYPDGSQVPMELEVAVQRINAARDAGLHPIEVAAMIYQSMVTIHPFGDGNGRTARELMNAVLVAGGWPAATVDHTPIALFPEQQLPGEMHPPGHVQQVVTEGLLRTISAYEAVLKSPESADGGQTVRPDDIEKAR